MSQVRDDLIAARDLLVRDGWTTDFLVTSDGRHCAVGAVLAVVNGTWSRPTEYAVGYMNIIDMALIREELLANGKGYVTIKRVTPRVQAALDVLAAQIPEHRGKSKNSWNAVATYNNASFEETVLDMFNNAIASLTEVEAAAATLPEVTVTA